jgi:hypothetical protein
MSLRLERAYDTDNHKLNTPKYPENPEELLLMICAIIEFLEGFLSPASR